MRLMTFPGVFRPRSDSELLAACAGAEVEPGSSVLDVFTGSAIVAIAAARAGAGSTTAVDLSRRAVACARVNARLNGARVRVLRGDMFAPVRGELFDLIVANPPYLPSADDDLPRGAARAWQAGRDGRALIDRFCELAPVHLRSAGRILLIHSSICDPLRTLAHLTAGGLECRICRRERGPFGPLVRARAPMLERRGVLAEGQREEEMLVFSAVAPDEVGGTPRG